MVKKIDEFVQEAKSSAEDAGFVWEEMTEDNQKLVIQFVVKEHYEENPEEAQAILDGVE